MRSLAGGAGCRQMETVSTALAQEQAPPRSIGTTAQANSLSGPDRPPVSRKPDMPVANAEVAVLIVGGGPVGLTARTLLQRWGVRAILVDKHSELSPFPRSRLVNTRSMEIYRQLGLAAKITDHAFAP